MRKSRNRLMNLLMSSLNKEIKECKTSRSESLPVDVISRRKFLRQSAKGAARAGIALGLPAWLSSCDSGTRNSDQQKDDSLLDIAILGGGMAGLNCANHLLDSGLNFKIFEASNRVGGRILTHYNDAMQLGIFPEFGGDFIDSEHEDMLNLAKEFNLELIDLIDEQEKNKWEKDIYFFDNRKIREKEIITEFKKIAGKISRDVESLGADYDTEDARRLDIMPLSTYIQSLPCAGWLKDLFVAAFVAASAHEQLVRWWATLG